MSSHSAFQASGTVVKVSPRSALAEKTPSLKPPFAAFDIGLATGISGLHRQTVYCIQSAGKLSRPLATSQQVAARCAGGRGGRGLLRQQRVAPIEFERGKHVLFNEF